MAEHSSLAPSGRVIADRWTTPSGIAFVVLFVVGLLIGSDSPNPDAPDAEWTAWFDDSGHRTLQIVGALLMVLAALAFVVFITGLVRRLRAETMNDGAAQVAHGGGILVAAAIAIGGIAINQISAAIEIGDIPIPSPDVLRTAEQFGYGVVLVLGGWGAALTVASASIAARGTTVLPRWLVTAGFVAAVILLFSLVFIPMVVFPLWVLAVAISVGRRSTRGEQTVRVNP